jgi:hypothetical protein
MRVFYHRRKDGWKRLHARRMALPDGRAKALFHSARKRAKKYGIEFTLTREWITRRIERGVCEVTGLPFDMGVNHGDGSERFARRPFGPSLDRTDPAGGYTPGNVKVVVCVYNAAKWDWKHVDVIRMAKALLDRS